MDVGGGCQRVISSMKKRFRITDNGQLYKLPTELDGISKGEGRGIAWDVVWGILYNKNGMCVTAHG